MWDVIKNAVTQLKDSLGVEIPGLPIEVGSVDVTSITEVVTTATEGVTASATTAAEDLTATVTETVTSTVSDVSGAVR